MKTLLDAQGSPEGLAQMIATQKRDGARGLLILGASQPDLTPAALDPVLQGALIPVAGGLFPEVIYGGRRLQKGVITIGLDHPFSHHVVPDLSNPEFDFESYADEHIEQAEFKTMFVFVDGCARRIVALVDALFNVFGLEGNYVGGGAGSFAFRSEPCVITNQGLLQDCAVMALTQIESGVGVRHGWRYFAGPLRVTETRERTVRSINWNPAAEVYSALMPGNAPEREASAAFLAAAGGYPLGIKKIDENYVVRDAVQLNADGSIECVGEIPEEAIIDILNADETSLLEASRDALAEAQRNYQHPAQMLLLFDCISRALYMGPRFQEELDYSASCGPPVVGALSIGEIANNGSSYLDFYNKTFVAALLGDES